MDAAKIKPSTPSPAPQPVKRSAAEQPAQARAETRPHKSPYDQPRPTTNAQGQKIGTRLNVVA